MKLCLQHTEEAATATPTTVADLLAEEEVDLELAEDQLVETSPAEEGGVSTSTPDASTTATQPILLAIVIKPIQQHWKDRCKTCNDN
jgi:hypothetical protein